MLALEIERSVGEAALQYLDRLGQASDPDPGPVVLDAEMTQMGEHPMEKKPWVGFNATTEIKRSDFDMGMFAPYVSDEVQIAISIEAMKAE